MPLNAIQQLIGALSLLLVAPILAASETPNYYTAKSVSVGAPDRWDYLTLDTSANRLYLAHGDRVDVVDKQSGVILGRVDPIPGGAHGIAIAPSLGKGYTDDGKLGQVIVFDLKSLKVINRIPGKPDADGMLLDPASGHVFIVNGDSESVTVVDPHVDQVIATIQIGGGLEFAVADDHGKIYVNGAERRELVRIDSKSNAVDARWPIPDCEKPHGLAIDVHAHRLFVSCINQLMTVVNSESGSVVSKIQIGRGTDAAAFDPQRQLIFSSNGLDGTVSVIRQDSPDEYSHLGEIKTAVTGRTMTIDPESGRLYVAAAAANEIPATPGGSSIGGVRPKPLPGSLKIYFIDPRQPGLSSTPGRVPP